MPMQHWEFDTSAAMPAAAFTHMAGSRQRERGELPQQPSGARRGITASPQAGGAQTEHQSCAGHSLAKIQIPFSLLSFSQLLRCEGT